MASRRVRLVEVGGQDTWQRIELGFAHVGINRAHVEAALDEVTHFIETEAQAELVDEEREIIDYGGGGLVSGEDEVRALEHRSRAARRPEFGSASDEWLPDAWREAAGVAAAGAGHAPETAEPNDSAEPAGRRADEPEVSK